MSSHISSALCSLTQKQRETEGNRGGGGGQFEWKVGTRQLVEAAPGRDQHQKITPQMHPVHICTGLFKVHISYTQGIYIYIYIYTYIYIHIICNI